MRHTGPPRVMTTLTTMKMFDSSSNVLPGLALATKSHSFCWWPAVHSPDTMSAFTLRGTGGLFSVAAMASKGAGPTPAMKHARYQQS